MAIWCQLYETTYFISDTSRLMQEKDLFDLDGTDGIITPNYLFQLAQAIHKLTGKQLELYEMLESQLSINVYFPSHHVDSVSLFNMPTNGRTFMNYRKDAGG